MLVAIIGAILLHTGLALLSTSLILDYLAETNGGYAGKNCAMEAERLLEMSGILLLTLLLDLEFLLIALWSRDITHFLMYR